MEIQPPAVQIAAALPANPFVKQPIEEPKSLFSATDQKTQKVFQGRKPASAQLRR